MGVKFPEEEAEWWEPGAGEGEGGFLLGGDDEKVLEEVK